MSDSDEDNVIRYGTPLEPYDEDEIPTKKKFQRDTSDQYAVDDQGRRRFHGAFTGGFSAGFGNSVSTPDGFTPATFRSSRTEKAQTSHGRPEDFMDEEDRSEFGIAPRLMQTKSDFSGQKRPHQMRFHDGPIPGEPVLEQMLKAVHETAAVRMLKAMGWRPGQGVGDRLSSKEKSSANSRRKVYGCFMPTDLKDPKPQSEDDASSDSDVDYETLFAPDDYEPYLLGVKNDRFGLGYSGLSRHSVLGNMSGEYGADAGTSRSHLVMKHKGKKVSIRGQAFGVGALEDDDEDIYALEDMTHYDFALGGPAAPKDIKKTDTKCGGVMGFSRSSRVVSVAANYPPPALPRGFTPAPARKTRFDPSTTQSRDQGLGRHELSSEARGQLLGETPVPKSVQHTTEDDPITKLLGRNVNFVTTTKEVDKSKELDFISIKPSDREVPKVFRPFASNPQKQRRYEKFLENRTSANETVDASLSEWERDRELLEFAQAAKLYRPLTGFMEDRLAAASGLFGVMTRTKGEWHPDPLVCKRFNVPHPYNAARSEPKNEKPKISYSIFEHLDTTIHDKESFMKDQATFSGSKSSVSRPRPKENTKEPIPEPVTSSSGPDNNGQPSSTNKRITVAELFLKESEKGIVQNEGNKEAAITETIKQFDKMELYKSIFLSDSEDEEDNETKNEEVIDFKDVPKNVERNLSPPRGIFANIDFDELNSWNKTDDVVKPSVGDNKEVEAKVSELDESSLYGPKIPETLQRRLQEQSVTADGKERDNISIKPSFRTKSEREKPIEINSSSSSDSWVEEKEVKLKKVKKKKSKKHKHKKSKHKKKVR